MDRKQQGRVQGEYRQYANTVAASGQKYGKSEPKAKKRGSRDESGGEDILHYAHLAPAINMFSDLVREREPNMELDGGKMSVFTFSGSDASDNDQSLDQSEEHETTKEYKAMDPTQEIYFACYG